MASSGHCEGRLIVVSAPSGAGKSSLVDSVLTRVDNLRYSVSLTTREARGGEKNGVDYHFVSEEEFKAARERGELLEWAEVHGHLYGTPRAPIEKALAAGEDVILDIDTNGAGQVRRRMRDATTVFVLPPSREALKARLLTRNLNAPLDLECRMSNARREVSEFIEFDYVIINDRLETAAGVLEAIIIAERHRASRQQGAARSIMATFGGESIDA